MDTYTLSPDQYRVIRWIRIAGGEITRHRLRRYRPTIKRWKPVEKALLDLIEIGLVEVYFNKFESMERGCGRPSIRYRLLASANNEERTVAA
jgi:hypothetical protein